MWLGHVDVYWVCPSWLRPRKFYPKLSAPRGTMNHRYTSRCRGPLLQVTFQTLLLQAQPTIGQTRSIFENPLFTSPGSLGANSVQTLLTPIVTLVTRSWDGLDLRGHLRNRHTPLVLTIGFRLWKFAPSLEPRTDRGQFGADANDIWSSVGEVCRPKPVGLNYRHKV